VSTEGPKPLPGARETRMAQVSDGGTQGSVAGGGGELCSAYATTQVGLREGKGERNRYMVHGGARLATASTEKGRGARRWTRDFC
jgi:hypothetical protein